MNNIQPLRQIYLKVHQEHSLYIEEYGKEEGIPVLYIHGGPGGFFEKDTLRFFDLKKYRVILYDQRGCGRSRGDFFNKSNKTNDLVSDIEDIRKFFNLQEFSIFGGSWGSFLALNYSIMHPNRIKKLYLWGIILGNKKDIDFIPNEFLSDEEKYFCENGFFLNEENWVLNNLSLIKDKEIYIAHGKMDNVCNYQNAIKIKELIPSSNVFIGEEDFHSSSSSGIESFFKANI